MAKKKGSKFPKNSFDMGRTGGFVKSDRGTEKGSFKGKGKKRGK